MAHTLQWLALIASIWLQCMSGTNFNFPAYSSQLKQRLSLSELQLNDLALASDAGKLLGWLSGVAAKYLPLWIVLFLGITLGVTGYGFEYLLLSDRISSLSYWQTFLLTSLSGNSICWINTVSYITVIQNFPFHRQIAVGLSTSYQGLSAEIFTNIVHAVDFSSPSENARTYLFLNTILPLIVALAAAHVVRDFSEGKSGSGDSGSGLRVGLMLMLIITILTGVFAVFGTFSGSILSPWVLVIGMGIFLIAPCLIPLVELIQEILRNRRNPRVWNAKDEDDRVSDDVMVSEEEAKKFEREKMSKPILVQKVRVREEIGPISMMTRIEFWLYYFMYLFGVTLGLVYMNNLGQIVESRGSSSTSALVSLSSSFGFFGRLIPAVLDYYLTRKNINISRPGLIATMMIPMAASFFLLLNTNIHVLYISTATIGLCTGAITAITVSTTAELFGTNSFGVNHNILVTNIPLGSFLFGDFSAWVYKKATIGHNDNCIGSKCYRLSFLTWGSLCSLGILLAILLHLKTKEFYCPKEKNIELIEGDRN